MNKQTADTTKRPGLLIAFGLIGNTPKDNSPKDDENIPYSSKKTEESTGLSPDRDHEENLSEKEKEAEELESESAYRSEIDERYPTERPDIEPDLAPNADDNIKDKDSD